MVRQRDRDPFMKVSHPVNNFDEAQRELDRVVRALNFLAEKTGISPAVSGSGSGSGASVLDTSGLTKRDGSAPPTQDWDFSGKSVSGVDSLEANSISALVEMRVRNQRVATMNFAKRWAFFMRSAG